MQAEILAGRNFDVVTDGYTPTVMMRPLSEPPPLRTSYRLPERIITAAHQACDVGDLQTAGQLLSVLDTLFEKKNWTGVGSARQRLMKAIVSTHERLWHLRHANAVVGAPLDGMLEPASMDAR